MGPVHVRDSADIGKPDPGTLMAEHANKMPLVLQPKQLEIGKLFYTRGIDAPTRIAGGGARSGGKSGGLRRIMLDRRQQFPGTFGALVRRTWPDLDRNHIQRYFIEYPKLRDYWHEGKKKFILPNKSEIHCMFAENQAEVDQKFWGPEFFDIMVDQAEQFNEHELEIIKSANRWPGSEVGICKTGLFFNPGGVGTEYLRRVFWMKRFNANERPSDYAFVHLFGWDNYVWFEPLGLSASDFYAMPDGFREKCPAPPDGDAKGDYRCCRFHLFIYRTSEGAKLNALPESLRKGHLLGSFDSFAGQYFAGVWDESRLILTARQEAELIQPWWERWMAHDDGFVHHASIGWFASGNVSPKLFEQVFGVPIKDSVKVVVVYRCLTESEVEPGDLVRRARKMTTVDEARALDRYFLSVDAWEKDSRGHSVAEEIAKELIRVQKVQHGTRELQITFPDPEQADNARIGGWRYLYAMMKKTGDVLAGKMNPTRTHEDYESDDASGYSLDTPLLFISGQCQDIIEAVPMAIRDSKHPGRHEDIIKLPTKADDVLDMLRYGAKSALRPKRTPFSVETAEKRAEMEQSGRNITEIAIMMKRMEAEKRRKQRGRRSVLAR